LLHVTFAVAVGLMKHFKFIWRTETCWECRA